MTTEEFATHLQNEVLEDGLENVIAKPLSDTEFQQWSRAHPDFVLPNEYVAMLRMANGMKLHSSDDSPKGLLHILPLKQVKPLSEQLMKVTGLEEEDLTDPPTCLMVGEDQDSAWCLGLDTATGHFLEVDYAGDSVDVGSISEMLDWLVEKLQQ